MQRVSDSVTSIFQLETRDGRLATCLQGGSTIVYSEKFGLGWRFGLQYAKEGWAFAKVKAYLDSTHCSSVTDAATVTVCLKDGFASEGSSFDTMTVLIADFGHGPPTLLGSFKPSTLVAHPYMWLTVTTKANFAPAMVDPLINTASALRQSMNDGEFADTKYYVMSKRKTWKSSGETRFVYANNAILDHGTGVVPILPSSANENSLLLHYQSESILLRDAEQNDFGPDGDSDIEEETSANENSSLVVLWRDAEQNDFGPDGDSDIAEEVKEKTKTKAKAKGTEQGAPSQPPPSSYYRRHSQSYYPETDVSDTTSDSSALSSDDDNTCWQEWTSTRPPGFRSTDTLTPEPVPQPLSPTQRMVLVRNTAFATWASYVYYCYTGHVSFHPLKSKDPLSRRSDDTSRTLRCSPKSMYRLAKKLENERLKDLAFEAIKSSLSESNILDEAFSWFPAQHTDIHKLELELLMKFRRAPEVSNRLEKITEAVTRGKKPYAHAMLHAFLARMAGA